MGKQKLKKESDLAGLKNHFMIKHVTMSFVMKQLLADVLNENNLLWKSSERIYVIFIYLLVLRFNIWGKATFQILSMLKMII